MNTPAATVAICSHNGQTRLAEVLDALSRQTEPAAHWELLVIDNASTDDTQSYCESRVAPNLPLRVVSEPRAGLSYARERAGHEAAAPLICFLDDDNIAEIDFVTNAITAFANTPRMGIAGSRVRPRWEMPPTPIALAVADFALAICERGDLPIQLTEAAGGVAGAGLCIRKDLLTDILTQLLSHSTGPDITGRKGDDLISGEDTAICILAHQAGQELWYQPSLKIEHVIPPGRVDPSYLKKLYAGIGRGQACVRGLIDPAAQRPLRRKLIGIKDYLRYLRSRSIGAPKANADDTARMLHALELSMIRARARAFLK